MTAASPQLNRIQLIALVVGVVGLVLSLLGAATSLEQFFHSYLFAYMFWLSFALGSFALMMIHHLSGGAWGLAIRRPLESAALTLPLMAVLFVPILITVFGDFAQEHYLYDWADPAYIADDPIVLAKTPYLNPGFFTLRAFIFFAIWIVWTIMLVTWSRAQDRTGDPKFAVWMGRLSGPGLVLYVLTMTFAVTDWVMSLDTHWFSWILGVIFMIGQGLATLAFVVVLLSLLSTRESFAEAISTKQIHDIGKLMFAFVVLWAYVQFSQYVIIWSSNVAEFVPWYVRRSEGVWLFVSLFLIVFHFWVPFLILLSRRLKRSIQALAVVALFLLVMRFIDTFWLIAPEFEASGTVVHWLDIVVTLGIGGIWLALFIWLLKRRPFFPVNAPEYKEALLHHGH